MVKKYIYMEAIRDKIFDPIVFDNHIVAKEFMVQKLASKLNPENSKKLNLHIILVQFLARLFW